MQIQTGGNKLKSIKVNEINHQLLATIKQSMNAKSMNEVIGILLKRIDK